MKMEGENDFAAGKGKSEQFMPRPSSDAQARFKHMGASGKFLVDRSFAK
jgi:hypothetical protein